MIQLCLHFDIFCSYNNNHTHIYMYIGMRKELARPEGAVWFAGEAAQESSMLSCSVHGAWLSGIAQAADICRYLGLPCLLPTMLDTERPANADV